MNLSKFESAFDQFIDRREYDQAENALFSIVGISFTAGWLAAGGKPPKRQKVIQLVHRDVKNLKSQIETDLDEPV